ncbi:FecR domain-containing protein [Thalassotalea psychrophila]|uniref:FecR domain-containing protein n=1 Tax=Thalassotalea psychrophila TaxID=3065647 RepID=A0ABY9TUB3_9GAMM|nr:FecR domain-containing protein [Colwelliaceae bacterium SQ149]
MSNVSQFYSKEHIQEQACLWISRIDRGLSSKEKLALVTWCQHNNKHYTTLLEMASYWDNLTVLNELSGLFPLGRSQPKSKKLTTLAMAASIMLVSLLSVNTFLDESFIPFLPSHNEYRLTQVQTFSTQVGEQASFTLSDGSHIQLNTNTEVRINYSTRQRQLTLLQGEAQFDVIKDNSRPFTVVAGEKSFTALGTIFNVQKNDEQGLELVVTEGRVLIAKANETIEDIKQSFDQPKTNLLPGILVKSGEKVTIAEYVDAPVKEVSLIQMQRDLAWQQGMLIFEGESLSTALADISRYTNVNFEIIDPQIADLKVAGYFRADDIDGLIASLEINLNITSSKAPNNTILLSSAK